MKKSTLTRILSALLAIIMLAEFLPLPVFASDTGLPEDGTAVAASTGKDTAEDPSSAAAERPESAEDEQSGADEPAADAPPADDAPDSQQATETPSEGKAETEDPQPEENAEDNDPTAEEPSVPGESDVTADPAEPDGQEQPEMSETEQVEPSEEETEPEEEIDEELRAELERQQAIMDQLDQMLRSMNSMRRAPANTSFESQLAQFPASYQPALKKLHEAHPNWVFVAVNTGLDWNAAVNSEFGTRSTTEYNYGPNGLASHLLLNNHDTYYDVTKYSSTNHYRPVDGRFVSTSRAAVAYYMDPRNFLTEQYVFQFENQTFSTYTEKSGITSILLSGSSASTGLAKITTYVATDGKKKSLSTLSSQFGSTYPDIIYNVGRLTNVSPYFLASKIVQETGGNTTSAVISGTVSGYTGYYNFYNIGSTSDANGQAYLNGLKYAKSHDWFNPIVAIKGGAEFLSEKYISKGQNTAYFMRFNVSPDRYYSTYGHQYMSALSAAALEGSKTCDGYRTSGALSSAFQFYIPVYKNMPDQTSIVSLTPTTKGKTTATVTLYKEPSTTSSSLVSVKSGTEVTILGGSVTSVEKVLTRLNYPYWYQVKVTVNGNAYIGYIYEQAISVSSVYNLKKGSTKSVKAVLTTSGNTGTIYYETSDPTVATVSDTGIVTAVSNGTCTIYAISGGGSFDAIGITVSQNGAASATIDEPVLTSISNTADGVRINWISVAGAQKYLVYRKTATTSWTRLGEPTSNYFVDTKSQSGTTYTYTVKAVSKDGLQSTYDQSGLSICYLATPKQLAAKASGDGIIFSWEAIPGAKAYNVYRKTSPSQNWQYWGRTTTNSYLDYTQMTAGTTYYYTVRAYDGGSTLSYFVGAGASAKATVSSLAIPHLKSAANVINGVTVTWDAVADAKTYRVYRKTATTGWVGLAEVTGTSYTDQTAASNTTYIYTVRAVSGKRISLYETAGISIYFLATPTSLSAKASSDGITFFWNAIPGAKAYNVYRKTSPSQNWQYWGRTTTNSYLDYTQMTAGTTYYYTVRAYDGGSTLSYFVGAGASAKATVSSLAIPHLKSAANVINGVTVTWDAVADAKTYRVYRKTATTGWVGLAEVTGTSYTDQTAASNTTYIYTVRAVSGKRISLYETAGISIYCLATPTALSAKSSTYGNVFSWNAVTGAQGYCVYRKTDPKQQWQYLGNAGNMTSYIDNNQVKAGTTYYYTVRAYNGKLLSYFVNAGVSVKATSDAVTKLNTPVLKSISNIAGGVSLTWGVVPGAQRYHVYRKTSTTSWAFLGDSNSTSYQDKTAVSGMNYTYTVRAYTGNVISGFDAKGLSILYLSMPALNSANASANGIEVKWSKVPGATTYRVYRRVGNSSWTRIAEVTSTAYTDKSVSPGTSYTYTVRALSGSAISWFYGTGISATAVQTSNLTNYVTTGMLNYRTGPGSSYAVAGSVASGKTVQVVTGGNVTVAGVVWYKVLINGKYYYMSSKYLKAASTGQTLVPYITQGPVNYRTAAGLNQPLAGTIAHNKTVQVVSGGNVTVAGVVWYKVLINGKYYYMSSQYLKAASTGQTLVPYITQGPVNYRTAAGLNQPLAGTIAHNKIVQVVSGGNVTVAGVVWYKVLINGKYYYMSSQYLKKA